MPAHSTVCIITCIATLFTLFWLTDQCYPFISDRQVHLTLIFLLLLDLSVRLLPDQSKRSPPLRPVPSSVPPQVCEEEEDDILHTKIQTLRRDNESLIKENAALSITIKNMSDKHTLLCEIRSTLNRQRRDSKELITLIHHGTLGHSSPDDDKCLDFHSITKAKHALHVGSRSEGCMLRPTASV